MAHGNHVVDVDEASFALAVLEESKRRPVVVDFWAPWCGPCRALGPVLERQASARGGAFVLAKINTDENPGIAQQFGIRGIPAVKAFVDGAVVNEFTGALPEAQVKRFLDELLPSEGKQAARAALGALADGRVDDARALVDAALAADTGLPLARLAAAELALVAGDAAAARAHVDGLMGDGEIDAALESVRARLAVVDAVASSDDEPALARRVEANDDDGDAHLGLAGYAALRGDLDGAFDHLVPLVGGPKGPARERAHALALAVLKLATGDAERTLRRRLSNVLF